MDDLTKGYLDQKLKEQTEGLKAFVVEQNNETREGLKAFVRDEIGNLAAMTAKGFEHTDKEISGLKQDVGEIKLEMGDMNKKIDKLDYKIEEVHDAVISLEQGPILDLQKRVQIIEKVIKA